MPDLDFERLGVAALIIALLMWALRMAIAKINKHEETIEVLHDRNTKTLINTLDSQNKAIGALDRFMEFIKNGR